MCILQGRRSHVYPTSVVKDVDTVVFSEGTVVLSVYGTLPSVLVHHLGFLVLLQGMVLYVHTRIQMSTTVYKYFIPQQWPGLTTCHTYVNSYCDGRNTGMRALVFSCDTNIQPAGSLRGGTPA